MRLLLPYAHVQTPSHGNSELLKKEVSSYSPLHKLLPEPVLLLTNEQVSSVTKEGWTFFPGE
jgi:hypothetical protein